MKRIWNEAMIFSLVGCVNTAVDFGVFTLLNGFWGINYLTSQVFSYSCGVLNSYLMNRAWTFKAKNRGTMKEFTGFVLINIVSLSISILVLYMVRDHLGLNVYISKIAATLFSLAVNFLGNKWLVFRHS